MPTYKKINGDYIVESTLPGGEISMSATSIRLSAPVQVGTFTTAERDALVGVDGQIIYNTTTNKFQGYAAGSWVDLS